MAFWNKIVEWFQDRSDRARIIRSFNKAASEAFICGVAPTTLKATITKGDRNYKTSFSNIFQSGFRITALTGRQLSRAEIVSIGETILDNLTLVRRLVTLGFDTLEVTADTGNYGCKWNLVKYAQIGLMLGNGGDIYE